MATKTMMIEITYDDEGTSPDVIMEVLAQAIHEGVEIPDDVAIYIEDEVHVVKE